MTVSDGDDGVVTQTYTVTVNGADDAAHAGRSDRRLGSRNASVDEPDRCGPLGHPGANDVDVETLTYGIAGGTVAAGQSTLAGAYGTLTVDTATGAYSYAKNAAAIEALDDGETERRPSR